MTCREEILDCANDIINHKKVNEFSILEILKCMKRKGTEYPDTTIRTHITSSMCVNAPANHAVRYADLERIDRALYKLLSG